MNLALLLCKLSAVLLISCECVLGTNFPPGSKQVAISFPPQQNVPLDFVSDTVLSETPITNFQPAERLPDSFLVTDSTTERPASADSVQILNEAIFSQAIPEEWSPPSGTIGPVATPRPDASDVAPPFIPDKEKTQFVVPLIKQDNTRNSLPPSVLVFSRGITGHYAEQGWFPIDSTVSRQPLPLQGDSASQRVPGNFPVFSSPVKPDLGFQPKVLPQWIPPPVSPSNIPRSVPENVPVVIIQNVSLPFALQPPATVINAALPSEPKPALFQPLDYFPKQISFPPPKTFIFSRPPVSEVPVANPPVEETPAPPEVTTTPPTTTMPPPPSPPPPPPPPPPRRPPPTYFLFPPKKEIASIFQPFYIPSTPMRFIPPQTYLSKPNADDSQFTKTILPTQYKTPVFSPAINTWIPGSNVLKSQFPAQNVWYAGPQIYRQKPVDTSLYDETSRSTVTGTETVPPLGSGIWIINAPTNGAPKANIAPMPLSTPIDLMPKPQVIVPVKGNVFPQILDQDVVPTIPGIPAAYSIYPSSVNSSYRFTRNMQAPLPLLRLYFSRPKQPSIFPVYGSESSSQLDSFPVSYTYPVMSYPPIAQPRPLSSKENCSTPASQDMNVIRSPASFYVQPSAPVYLPMPQNSYSFVPIRPSIPDVPAVVFQPFPTADSRPPPAIETPVAQEPQEEKRKEPVLADQLPPSSDVSSSDNVVIAPVFPFINPPVSFPKQVTTNENIKRSPYYFRYGQSDGQGTLQYRSEETNSDGMVKGSYGYRGSDGIFRKVDYTADSGRYRAVVRASEPSFPIPQSSDLVIKDNENSFAGSPQEKNIAESEA